MVQSSRSKPLFHTVWSTDRSIGKADMALASQNKRDWLQPNWRHGNGSKSRKSTLQCRVERWIPTQWKWPLGGGRHLRYIRKTWNRNGNGPWWKNLKLYFGKGARQIFKAQTEIYEILHSSITLKMLSKLQNILMLNKQNGLILYLYHSVHFFIWGTIWICFKWFFSSLGHSFVEIYLCPKVVCRTKKVFTLFSLIANIDSSLCVVISSVTE